MTPWIRWPGVGVVALGALASRSPDHTMFAWTTVVIGLVWLLMEWLSRVAPVGGS